MRGKLCALLLGVAFALCCLTGCDTGVPAASAPQAATTVASLMPEVAPAGAEIAMVLTESDADSVYGQSVWATVSRVAGESAATSGLYRAGVGDDTAARASIELAVKGGARLVVLLGEELSGMAEKVGRLYPEIDFILLDMPYGTKVGQNAVLVRYSPEQSGWMAGYASVYEELGNVAFATAKDEETQRYTLGFLLGADAAAQDRKAALGSMRAWPLVLAEEEEAQQAQLEALYLPEGMAVRTFFVNNAGQAAAALRAAAAMDGYVSGTASMLGDTGTTQVLARVSYDPQNILSALLAGWLEERFPGGDTLEGTVAGGEIGLELPKEGLGRFNERAYQTILDRFRIGSLATRIAIDTAALGEERTLPQPEELALVVFAVAPQAEPVGGSSVAVSQPQGVTNSPAAPPSAAPSGAASVVSSASAVPVSESIAPESGTAA